MDYKIPENPQNCPKCGSSMALRKARRGPNVGNIFWGCSNYPKCKGTRTMVTKVSPSKGMNPEGGQLYPREKSEVEDKKTEPWLQKLGLKEGEKSPDRVGVAPKREKDYPLRYIDEGIGGTREDNKGSRAQNLLDTRKRRFE